LGTGVRAPATLPAIAVTHDALGKPMLAFGPELQAEMERRSLVAHLSISDERDVAVAFVVLEHK
jgi:holo-[acyl-carrier protein] synthase